MTTDETNSNYVRSPELIHAQDSVVVVVDVQEKLLPHIHKCEQLERNVGRLVQGANLANVPVLSTEQYPQGLGATVGSIAGLLDKPSCEKLSFSCMGCEQFRESLAATERRKVLLCGMETHICVQQTAFDLLSAGYCVFLVVDAIGSRSPGDCEVALRRMETGGAVVATVEMCLFEWCERAGTELFKSVRKLIV